MSRAVGASRLPLRLSASLLLSLAPWMLTAQSAATLARTPPADLAALAAATLGAHLALLGGNAALVALLPPAAALPSERVSLVVMASQKTVIVAAAVAVALPAGDIDAGLVMLPCVVGHLVQTLCDSALAAWWRARQPPQ